MVHSVISASSGAQRAAARYASTVAPADGISPRLIEQMAALYLDHYDGTSRGLFRRDLSRKDEALLVFLGRELVGFTTLKFYEVAWRGALARVVYSGDTIVSPAHWGQQELAFAWIARVGRFKRLAPAVPLYWYLLVKGHRTFKYLSVFARSFFPHWEQDRGDLKPLADKLATGMFGEAYNPSTGVVEFAESRGHLKSAIAFPSEAELEKRCNRFFFERNPGYLRGHELVCVCELDAANLKPLAARLFRGDSRSAL